MQVWSIIRTAAAIAALIGGASAVAQDEQPPAQPQQALDIRVHATEMLSPDMQMNVAETTIAPGHVSPSHRHDGSVFVYVLEGEIRSRIDDGEIVLYRAGDSWFEPFGVEHSFFENASDTDTARFLVVRVGPPREPQE